jgi:hypothetical protein
MAGQYPEAISTIEPVMKKVSEILDFKTPYEV